MQRNDEVTPGVCRCGCGEQTPIAAYSKKSRGYVKGEPLPFVPGHQHRGRLVTPIEERFWSKVDRREPDDCWPWMAARFPTGYGALARDRRLGPAYAHRLSWELHHGREVPRGAHVLHRCDNPPCVNPAHLFLGDHPANMRDMDLKGRARGARGEAHRSAKLTADDVRAIRAGYSGGRGEITALAAQYGVTKMTISHIIRRRTWRWLD